MNHHQVSEIVALADLNQVLEHVATSIDTSSIRKDQLQLFLECHETLAWVAASRDKQLRIAIFSLLILVIDVRASDNRVLVGKSQVVRDCVSLLAKLCRYYLVLVDCILHLDTLVLLLLLFELLALLVEILFAKANIASDHFNTPFDVC